MASGRTRPSQGDHPIPRNRVQQANANLSKGNAKKVEQQVLDEISTLSSLMRDKNNIVLGKQYRLDARQLADGNNGGEAHDYKVDIQTVTKQKSLSETVAVVFLSPAAPETSLADFRFAVLESLRVQDVYRVT